ncbi:hypothetical protein EV2_044554 [Malus domestica]
MCRKILGIFSVFGFWDGDRRIWSGMWAGRTWKKIKIEDTTDGSTANHDMQVAFDGQLVQSWLARIFALLTELTRSSV